MRTYSGVLLLLLSTSLLISQGKRLSVPSQYAKIQLAIDAAANGDTVLVARGTYKENLRIAKKIVLGSQYIIDKDTSNISKTVVDGSGATNPDSGAVITVTFGADTTTIVSGLTITGGKGNYTIGTVNDRYHFGGGIAINSVGARISHNYIYGNRADSTATVPYAFGGGVGINVVNTTEPLFYIIEDNFIANNTIVGRMTDGCAVSVGSPSRITRNILQGNRSISPDGNFSVGAISIWNYQPGLQVEISSNIIRDNSSTYQGGAIGVIRNITTGPTVRCVNNLIVRNSTTMRGAGIFLGSRCNMQLVNNTIADNICQGWGNGLSADGIAVDIGAVVGINNIFWNIGQYTNEIDGPVFESFHNNLIRGESSFGENNFSADPKFTTDGQYRLTSASPCIAAGTTSRSIMGYDLQAPSTDLYGTPRPLPAGTQPDLGAIESDGSTRTLVNFNRAEVRSFNFPIVLKRYYIVVRPLRRETEQNRPVVLFLSGYNGNSNFDMSYMQFHRYVDSLGWYTVYPEPYQRRWNSGINDNPSWPTPAMDDVTYISMLIDTLKAQYGIDTSRVYVAGFSNGGCMAYKLAATLAHRIKAVAAVCGTTTTSLPGLYSATRRIPILMMNGTSDPIVPLGGGKTGWNSIGAALAFWQTKNKASLLSETVSYPNLLTTDNSTVQRYRYNDSTGFPMVWYYSITGGGHEWPGGPAWYGSGNINRDIDASSEIIRFFNYPNPVVTDVEQADASQPKSFELLQNFPNPFNPATAINYTVAAPSTVEGRNAYSHVRLSVFDLLGREVAVLVNEQKPAGTYKATWDASRFPSGVYFYRLTGGQNMVTKKMLFTK